MWCVENVLFILTCIASLHTLSSLALSFPHSLPPFFRPIHTHTHTHTHCSMVLTVTSSQLASRHGSVKGEGRIWCLQ